MLWPRAVDRLESRLSRLVGVAFLDDHLCSVQISQT